MAIKVTNDALQLFGAAGVSAEYPIARYFRDAKVVQIIEGTNQIQRNIIARSILGLSRTSPWAISIAPSGRWCARAGSRR